jgi:hypothetical protein
MGANQTEAGRPKDHSRYEWPYSTAQRPAPERLVTTCQTAGEEAVAEGLGRDDARLFEAIATAFVAPLGCLDRRLDGIDAEIIRGRAEMRAEYAAVKEEIRQLRTAIARQESLLHLLMEALQGIRRSGRARVRSLGNRQGR